MSASDSAHPSPPAAGGAPSAPGPERRRGPRDLPAESLATARRARASGVSAPVHARAVGWALSASLHAAAAVIAFLVTWTVVRLVETPRDPVVADFASPRFEPLASLSELSETSSDTAAESPPPSAELAEALDEALAAAAGGPLDLIAGTSRSIEASPLPRNGESADHAVSFAGLRASNARSIVYVVDASGSMIGSFRTIVDELARSLSALVPAQSYAVIFFQRNAALAAPPANRLRPVSREGIGETLEWIRGTIVPAGRSNPLEALERALSLRPDCVFLLSCNITGTGQFELDQRTLLEALDRLNPIERSTGRRRATIQCIQFLDADPLDTMRRIAERHGGGDRAYKFLSRAELGLAPTAGDDADGEAPREGRDASGGPR